MAQDEWTQFYRNFTGEEPTQAVEVGTVHYGNGFYGIRLHNNGKGPALYIYGAGVDHLFVPQGSDFKPYDAARTIQVNGGVDAVVRSALAEAKRNPVYGKHE